MSCQRPPRRVVQVMIEPVLSQMLVVRFIVVFLLAALLAAMLQGMVWLGELRRKLRGCAVFLTVLLEEE